MTREDRAREAAYALAAQHDIDLFRVIRRAGRKDRDKARAVSLYLAETIISEAAAMRERAVEKAKEYGRKADGLGDEKSAAAMIALAIRALPATGEE